jgi:hypothetical protein
VTVAAAEVETPSQELTRLLNEAENAALDRPSVFFTPNPGQWRYLEKCHAVLNDPSTKGKTITLRWMAGNGTGKTTILFEIALALMEGPQSEWLDTPFFRNFPRPCLGRFTAPGKALERGLVAEMLKVFRPHLAPGYPKKAGQQFESVWRTHSGSQLELLTWDMDITAHAGVNRHFLLKDEPGPKSISSEDDARLRGGGPVFHTVTAVDETGLSRNVSWIFDEIQAAEEGTVDNLHTVYADLEDNCEDHARAMVTSPTGHRRPIAGLVPHVTILDKYKRWKAESPATLQARFFGRHVRELGRVLKEYSDEKHVCGDEVRIFPGYPRYAALDVHSAKPHVFCYYVFTHFHQLILWREVVSDDFDELVRGIKEIYARWGWPQTALIDPRAMEQNPVTKQCMYDALVERELTFNSAGKEKTDKDKGIADWRVRLTGVDGKPLFLVHESCRFSISQFKRWMWDQRTKAPAKEHDDAPENTYRVVLHLPLFPTASQARAATEAARGTGSSLVAP